MITRHFAVALCFVSITTVGARAQTADPTAATDVDACTECEGLLQKAVDAYSNQQYAEARELFGRAHALSPSARTLRALGIVSVARGDHTTAKHELEAALEERVLPLTEEQRREVAGMLDQMARDLAIVALYCTPEGATIELDGLRTTSSELLVQPGVHIVAVSAPEHERREQSVTLRAAQRFELHIALAKLPASAAQPVLAVATEPERPTTPALAPASAKLWPWLGAAGITAVVGGATLGVLAANDYAKVENAKRGTQLSQLSGAHDRTPWMSGFAIGLGIAGVAALSVAAVDFLNSGASSEKPDLTWTFGPAHAAVKGRF